MKYVLRITLFVLVLSVLIPLNVFAAGTDAQECNIIRFEDGSYIVIEIESTDTYRASEKNANKHYTYYDSDNQAQWKATLNGTFTYDGTTSTCTAASTSVVIYSSVWSVGSKSASKSGNTATGNFTLVLSLIWGATTNYPVTLTLSCDKNGNLT